MKKFLSIIIAAALIVTAAGCNKNETVESSATTTTEAAADLVDDATDSSEDEKDAEEETDLPADEETPVEDSAEDEAEDEDAPVSEGETIISDAYISAIAEKAPLYAEYVKVINTVPYTVVLEVVDEDGNGVSETQLSMAAMDKIAMNVSANGAATRIVMSDYNYYMISDDTKAAIYYTLDEAAWQEALSGSASSGEALNIDSFEVTAGSEELFGNTYNTEDMTDGTTSLKIYYNTDTNRAEYMTTNGQTVKIVDYYGGYSEELFSIPDDYTLQEMSADAE